MPLDLEDLGFPRVEPETRGRPPYHPGDLLCLYLNGHLFDIRSSHALECEANRNLEVIWLLKRLARDLKTIADFRKANDKAMRNLCAPLFNFASVRVCTAVNSSPSTDPNASIPAFKAMRWVAISAITPRPPAAVAREGWNAPGRNPATAGLPGYPII